MDCGDGLARPQHNRLSLLPLLSGAEIRQAQDEEESWNKGQSRAACESG